MYNTEIKAISEELLALDLPEELELNNWTKITNVRRCILYHRNIALGCEDSKQSREAANWLYLIKESLK
jgi:hypothetical protein